MKNFRWTIFLAVLLLSRSMIAQKQFNDTILKNQPKFIMHMLGHSSVFIEYDTLNIYVDPYSGINNFTGMPKAHLILVSHGHSDHFDISAINLIKQAGTMMVYPQVCATTNKYSGLSTIMANGDSATFSGIPVKAVPAYNLTKTQHPKGVGNGYVLRFGNKQLYFAGDTEKVPEMAQLKNIHMAFLGYSQPYNMTADSILAACKLIKPTILVPCHYDNNDPTPLINLMQNYPETKVFTDQESVTSEIFPVFNRQSFNLYPNPVKEYLYLNTADNTSCKIMSISGRIMFCGKLYRNTPLSTNGLAPGNYLIQYGNGNKIYWEKFVKE